VEEHVFDNPNTTDESGVYEITDYDEIHTLEVRRRGDKIQVEFDGQSWGTLDDITETFDKVVGESTTDEETFNNVALFYRDTKQIRMKTGHPGVDHDGSNATENRKWLRCIAYLATFDFKLREGGGQDGYPSGTARGNNVHDNITSRTDEIEIYGWTWHNLGEPTSIELTSVAVTGGSIYKSENNRNFNRVTTTQELQPNATRIDAVEFFQKYYLVDGENYKIYNPSDGTVVDWNADEDDIELPGGDGSKGSLGSGEADGNSRCAIVTSWLGRLVMAGMASEPQNWFMSEVSDALGWDTTNTTTGAVIGSSTKLGESADPVTALIPHLDSNLLIGGTNSLYLLTGDPLWSGTKQHALSRDVGIVGPDAWTYGPDRMLYFMGEDGMYVLAPNEYNVTTANRISAGRFDKEFSQIDFNGSNANLVYNQQMHGVHIFLSPHTNVANRIKHYYYDRRSNSFWTLELPAIIGPTTLFNYQSPDPTTRNVLLGGFDGHVRTFDSTAKDDDGTAIPSYVWIGPIQMGDLREIKLTELVAILDRESQDVGYEVYVADSVEEAENSTPVYSSTWSNGRNPSQRLRARGAAIFLRLYSSEVALPWTLEKITAVIAIAGRVRDR